jgi:hypothetical protein
VGKARVWLLIAAVVLTGLVAYAGLGRYVLNVPATPVRSTSSAIDDDPTNNVSCFDTSPHKTLTVTVRPDVQLEVLDWGGTGETMVLLTGLGDNAHVYDEFAYQARWSRRSSHRRKASCCWTRPGSQLPLRPT